MFHIEPVGRRAARTDLCDGDRGGSEACIELLAGCDASALEGLVTFSHAEILFVFDRVDAGRVVREARHPRNNPDWPRTGIFAQRGKNRPNRIGSTIVRIVRRTGRLLHVAELDAIDGTPVIDIKPVLRAFLPAPRSSSPPGRMHP